MNEKDDSQQPEARGVVDEAMVERAYQAWRKAAVAREGNKPAIRAALTAALTEAHRQARGVADGWKPAGVEPPHNPKKDSLGTEYLIHPPTSGGDRTAFYGRRLGGAACWYRYGAPVHGVNFWQELPADPAAITEARNVR